MTILSFAIVFLISIAPAHASGDFELLFNGNGDINSFIYFRQDAKYFIDTDVNASIDAFRYKNVYLNLHLLKQTSMGRKYNSDMVFDPNRADYSFGITLRHELPRYYYELLFHHDSFHDIDRWENNSVYWNSPRLGFGTLNYLSKHKYHNSVGGSRGIEWQGILDYYVLASFYAPKGAVWQKRHDYDFTLLTEARYQLTRFRRVGTDLESSSLWVIDRAGRLRSNHGLKLNLTFYGSRGAAALYLAWWPHDDQMIRNRDGRTAFGVHLGF
jgi:hypothetical protein